MNKPVSLGQDQLNRRAMVTVMTIVRIKFHNLKVMVVLMALISLRRGGNCEFSVVLQISAHHCSLLLLLCACCNAEVRTFCEKNAHCRHKFILFEDEDDGKRPLFVFKKPI